MTPSRADLIRMAREAGVNTELDIMVVMERFAALVSARVWSIKPPPAMVVNTADLDPALLRDMLAKAQAMPLLPTPEAIAAAVAAEREACAALCEALQS